MNNSTYGNRVIVNGKEVPLENGITNNVTIVNNRVFVDGKEYIDGKWKLTVRALWYKLLR